MQYRIVDKKVKNAYLKACCLFPRGSEWVSGVSECEWVGEWVSEWVNSICSIMSCLLNSL